MNPIEKFLEWFVTQEKETRDTVAFHLLYLAPDFDNTINAMMFDKTKELELYLLNSDSSNKIAGKAIYIINSIDFTVIDYGNIDSFIDSQSIINNVILQGEKDGENMDNLKNIYKNGNKTYANRQLFKENWLNFKSAYFNLETINEYLKNELLNKI